MKTVVHGFIALATVCVLAVAMGCSDKKKDTDDKSTESSAKSGFAAEFPALADKVCTCKTEECVEVAGKEFGMLEAKLQDTYKTKEDVPKNILSAYEAADSRAEKCFHAVMARGGSK